MFRNPGISFDSYERLLRICAAASHVYRPVDPSHPGPPTVFLDPIVAPHRPFQMRAHQLLARELVAYLATTDRNWDLADANIYLRDAAKPGGGGGGQNTARFFRVYALGQPFIHAGGSTPQVPGPSQAYLSACAGITADLAQLELDLSASSASDALIDPVLAADASGRIGGVH